MELMVAQPVSLRFIIVALRGFGFCRAEINSPI
jgi:hypothetical protein